MNTSNLSIVDNKLFVYKILSKQDWIESKQLGYLKPQLNDDKFIHLSEHDQVTRIIKKYWLHVDEVLIAKIDATKMIGQLVKEANPGGTNTYYHLYNGKIPLDAVIEVVPYRH